MAEFKGTKGSWRVDGHFGHQGIETMNVMQVNGGITVATINKFSPYEIPKEVQEANAKLIAAAPDLLKACLKVIKGGYGCGPSVEYMDSLKKECELAIKKATD